MEEKFNAVKKLNRAIWNGVGVVKMPKRAAKGQKIS